MIDELVEYVDQELTRWKMIYSKIKWVVIVCIVISIFFCGALIYVMKKVHMGFPINLSVCLSALVGGIIIGSTLKYAAKKYLGIDVREMSFLNIQIQELTQYLKDKKLYSRSQIEYLIESLKRKSQFKEVTRFRTLAVASFLGACLLVIYQRYIEICITNEGDARELLYLGLSLSSTILGVWITFRPLLLEFYQKFLSSKSEKAERVLSLLENLYLEMIVK